MSILKATDAFCYICRGVLIEPVTLPCFHVFCFSCFEQSMQETSYSCPLCRRRISNWVRSVKKTNKLINFQLWAQIKEQFSEQVKLKLSGEDDGLDQRIQKEYPVFASTSKPGEVAEEFSKLLSDFKNENERLNQAEELASRELIVKLREEEERKLQEMQESNMLRLKEDLLLAKKLQEEINKDSSQSTPHNANKTVDKKFKKSTKRSSAKQSKGPMDNFLLGHSNSENIKQLPKTPPILIQKRSTSAESTDSIRMETNLFKPIKKVQKTSPKEQPDGGIREVNLTKVTPLKLTFNNVPTSSSPGSIIEGKKIHSIHSAFVNTNFTLEEVKDEYESPSKRLKFSLDELESVVLKDITLGENNDSNSSTNAQEELTKKKSSLVKKSTQENFIVSSKIPKFCLEDNENDKFDTQDYLNPEISIEEKLIEEQRRIEKIILQEKEDRLLALKLSREWESELRDKPLTRSREKKINNVTSKKTQQTLIETISGSRSKRK